ncbi:MAG: hypothetical protein ACRYG6_08295 [Janthinobacterium lividum]
MTSTHPRRLTDAERIESDQWNYSFPMGLRTDVCVSEDEEGGVYETVDVWDRCGDTIYAIEPIGTGLAVRLTGCGPDREMPSVAAALEAILEHELAHLVSRRGLLRANAML